VGLGGQLGAPPTRALKEDILPPMGVGEVPPTWPYSQGVPVTWAGAGPDMEGEGGNYVQPFREGGVPPNFDSEFDRDFLPPQLGSEDGDFDNFEYFEDFGDDGELVMMTMMKRALEIAMV
jgi:hypothetical protein